MGFLKSSIKSVGTLLLADFLFYGVAQSATPIFYERIDYMKIFVVGGKSGSGKNEVAKMIEEFYIYKLKKCVTTEFSKYIKLFAKELTDWDGISQNKPRRFLQTFGAKVRSYDERFLTKRMIEDISLYEDFADVVIISDARMPLEFEDMKENFDDVTSILVINNFAPSKLTIEEQSDITERALENYDEFDYIIANDDLAKTKEKVFKMLEELK